MAKSCDYSFLANLTPDEALLLAVFIALSITKENDEQTLYVLSTLFTTIGSMLNLLYKQYDYLVFLSSS